MDHCLHVSVQSTRCYPHLYHHNTRSLPHTTPKRISTMSFAVPRNVPTFNDPQRRYEDALWGSSGTSRHTHNKPSLSNGFGLANGGAGRELPMYKDKPYNYPASRRRGRKRMYLLIAFVLGGVWLYWKGWFGGAGTSGIGDGRSLWDSIGTSGKGPVDWDLRREQVKKAMEISWAGYEKYAWGMSQQQSTKTRTHTNEGTE